MSTRGLLATLLGASFVPVVASIAVDEVGQAYNVNADVVAAELAIALAAHKLVYLNDVPGLDRALGRPVVGAVGGQR